MRRRPRRRRGWASTPTRSCRSSASRPPRYANCWTSIACCNPARPANDLPESKMSKQDEKTLSVLHDAVVPIEMMLATVAKTLCSAVFVSGRDPEEAISHSCLWSLKAQLLPEVLQQHARWRLDLPAQRVDLSITLTPAVADDLIAAHRAAHPGFDADWAAEKTGLVGLGSVTRTAVFTGGPGAPTLAAARAPPLPLPPRRGAAGPPPRPRH